jgi:hypothetical protein
MGTTLTGTTPQDTYDSLIKVTDNGPLSGTAKYLSDGLGNDSVLALSTSRVLVNHTNTPKGDLDIASSAGAVPLVIRGRSSDGSAQTEFWSYNGATRYGVLGSTPSFSYFGSIANTSLYFLTNSIERMRIDSSGNVGIGTDAPVSKLTLNSGAMGAGANFSVKNFTINGGFGGGYTTGNIQSALALFDSTNYSCDIGYLYDGTGYAMTFATNPAATSSVPTERLRILSSGGLTFNGDTAAANALDDYEEGTFTPTFNPASGAYGTITYANNEGKYTKIGNRVDFSLRITLSAYSAGSASGNLQLAGLPYACVGTYVGSVSMSIVDDFAANRYPIKGFVNDTTTYILLRYMTALNTNEAYVSATDITASSTIRISGTYFTA